MKSTGRKVFSAVFAAAVILLFAAEVPTQALPFTTVYITRPGRFYHRRGCIALRHGAIAISVSNAKEQGFQPCRRCAPPTW
ncbi:MAG: hypothetical protein LBR87_00750 [Synergistaceae bacterium]|jgi:micrococcal nuclease|nr:hypothetical protein [Synergistaceae bacterium]